VSGVIALDLPGFAASADEDFDATPGGCTSWLDRWFAEQGLDRPHVAGNSLGGGVALELARRRAVASATAPSPVGFWTARQVVCRHVALRGCGHVPCSDDPEAVAAALLAGSRDG
jgi:pimeloyl-ACP methyl ester carboxylesterase